jgi:Ca2+:H+ antiporter
LFAIELLKPEAHTPVCTIRAGDRAIVALLSRATESVAAKTGDMIGGLLNATLGNLTELLIALAALRAGQPCSSRLPSPGQSSQTHCSC